jgi:SAM-dependent methyltransferase
MSCPLCGEGAGDPAWMGDTRFDGREFHYRECRRCRSLYCDPMPDDATVALMYGPAYAGAFGGDDPFTADAKEPARVVAWLRAHEPGTFLDFGCGQGELLSAARNAGWRAVGVELDAEVARRVAAATGLDVHASAAALPDGCADVLHLGDVIEHLTRVDEQLRDVLRLVRPGGTLIAQGPLEANDCLFAWTLKLARKLRGTPPGNLPPYHVLLATSDGQRRLFRRLGLEEQQFSMSEVAWPAPARLDTRRPKAAAMFLLRRASQTLSRARPNAWGNRYLYVGRWHGTQA